MKLTTVIDWGRVSMKTLAKSWRRSLNADRSILRTELANLLVNIKGDEDVLDGMRKAFLASGGGCCASCMFGDFYWRRYEHLQRRLERANQIQFKLWRDSGAIGCAPRPIRSDWSRA